MKTGLTISNLAEQIRVDAMTRRDFKIDTRAMDFVPNVDDAKYGALSLYVDGNEILANNTEHCAKQIASHAQVPWQYAERMFNEQPELAAHTFNTWLHAKADRRLLRTRVNGTAKARAFLSDRYRVLDNDDLAMVVLPKLENPALGLRVMSAQITETRFYIQAVTERVTAQIKVGDEVQAGVIITNSEVGASSLRVEPLIYRLICMNGMISNIAVRKYHVGRASSSDAWEEMAREFMRDETLMLEDKAFFSKVSDLVDASLSDVILRKKVDELRLAAGEELPEEPVAITEVVSKNYGFSEGEKQTFLANLSRDGDFTKYGVIQATTAIANTVESYDRAVELERFGGEILDSSTPQFVRQITDARKALAA